MRLLLLLFFIPALAAGQEKFSIPSLDGKLELPGYLFEAITPGPRPAVISLHGCAGLLDAKGGLSRARYRVAEYLNVEGMHMLALDSFTPRSIKSICDKGVNQRTIDDEDRRGDVHAAMRWLAQRPNVDRGRIAVVGYSHGGGAVLSVVERTDKAAQVQPRAAIAFYPSCQRFVEKWSYEIAAPLLLMIGEADEVTPAHQCARLHDKVRRAQPAAPFEFIVYPGAHHAFDGHGPLQVFPHAPRRTGGVPMFGAHPEAREKALRRMFDFLSEKLEAPLALAHDARLSGHRYVVPPASGFAAIDDVAAVPLSEKGRARYQQYLGLGTPKAFAITEKGGWYWRSDDAEAMRAILQLCAAKGSGCWLYAVDDRVVWSRDAAARIDAGRLQRNAPPTRTNAASEAD